MKEKGNIITLVLIFGSMFLILLGGLFNFVLLQFKNVEKRIAKEQSFYVAEAGVEYYKWCLNNFKEEECEGEMPYYDNMGRLIGYFNIERNSLISCGETIQENIVSIGRTIRFPSVERKIRALYSNMSVGKFAFLLNSNVWAGSDIEIRGNYHSNGGIRMDGENQSLVSSSLEEWVCTSSFGCSTCPSDCRTENSQCICPGVFTTTNNPRRDLFEYPFSFFDFNRITLDLANIKNIAQASGLYLPPSTNINSQGRGYRIVLNNNSVEVWIVIGTSQTYAYSLESGWHYDRSIISNQYLYNTYNINSDCGLFFIEDDFWIEGNLDNKVTFATADFINTNRKTNIYLKGNIEYSSENKGITLISEGNIFITPDSPNNMRIKGIFIAQTGYFGRKHFPNNLRNNLEITGSIVSSGRVGTQWISGSQIVSGYLKRENYIDLDLVYFPPAFTPRVSSVFEIIKWEEIK